MSEQNDKPYGKGFTLVGEKVSRFDDPHHWEGCLFRRFFGYLIDIVVISILVTGLWVVNILTLGLLTPLVVLISGIAPFIYHTMMISYSGATVGQRLAGLCVRDAGTGDKPSLIQAFILTMLFYFSLSLAFIPLLYVFFDPKERFLHDLFSGTRTLRADSQTVTA